MSNLVKRIAKQSNRKFDRLERKERRRSYRYTCKRYTSFNIFTRDGENLTVTSKTPMTLAEAQYHYRALSISGND